MERNELCWCGSGKKYKKCHMPIEEKMMLHAEKGEIVPTRQLLKTPEQIEKIRISAALNTAVLDEVAKHIHIGMSTAEIDDIVYRYTTEHGGIPAPLNYQGFPKSVCTSLNNEICHGIPDENIILQEGDIINVDVSTIVDGYFSDASRMFKMGKISDRAEKLIRVTEECVERGLAAAKPWGHLGDIADAINSHAKANGYSVVEEIGGHGIGLAFHEDPFVSYVTPKGSEMLLVPGMMFTIEPMINEGSPDFFVDEDNGWTVYTIDDGLSAQIEYMVLVKENGIEVLIDTASYKTGLPFGRPVFSFSILSPASRIAPYSQSDPHGFCQIPAGFDVFFRQYVHHREPHVRDFFCAFCGKFQHSFKCMVEFRPGHRRILFRCRRVQTDGHAVHDRREFRDDVPSVIKVCQSVRIHPDLYPVFFFCIFR